MALNRALVAEIVTVVLAAVGAIAIALTLTPMQEVSTVGQRVEVGVTGPSLALHGPGELDLFGQRIPTAIHFAGPFRPRIKLTHITLSEQVGQFAAGDGGAATSLHEALVRGWKHYFGWEVVVAGLAAAGLAAAATGWLRRPPKRALLVIGITVVVTELINLGAIMTTAYSAPGKLRNVHSLQELVGGTAPPPIVSRGRPDPAAPLRIVVLGDSTAAGLGNAPLEPSTPEDRACHRSEESFAVALSHGTGRSVTNLACSGASIRKGLLGPQAAGGRTLPPQVGTHAVAAADLIIVSIGANDVRWADILKVCAVSRSCSNNAERAYFQQQLAGFSRDYLQLLSELQSLPRHPRVIVNRYFDPFPGSAACLTDVGMTPPKQAALHSELAALNDILTSGAQAAGFGVASPNFTGHGVCSPHPYVQGLDDEAPFHPTPSGQLAIALAVERAGDVSR